MRIVRSDQADEHTSSSQAALDAMAVAAQQRGPVCTPDCVRAKHQHCSRKCPYIPQVLSSDPVNYPIEPLIAPLAFELKKLGVFEPCWSCEGHNDQQQRLQKLPAVWFYAHSVTHVRVLSDSVRDMFCDRRLSSPWQVKLCFSDPNNVNTTFSLDPAAHNAELTLVSLQNDVAKIAEELEGRVIKKAATLKKLQTG